MPPASWLESATGRQYDVDTTADRAYAGGAVASLSLWSELVPYRELMRPSLLDVLAARGVGLFVAVTPERAAELPPVLRACRQAGVEAAVWPMLSHADGRWPNAGNVEIFSRFCDEVLDRADSAGAAPRGLAVDLEPPIALVPDLIRLRPRAIRDQLSRGLARRTAHRFAELVAGLEARGLETTCASFPLVVADRPGIGGWQRLLGTPVDAPPFSRVTNMVYTSLIEGYGRGRLGRRDVLALLGMTARAAKARYGARASLSLGAVGRGILGDEPIYRSPDELAEDVAVARAAGIDHLVLFSLGGVLSRPPASAWLDALASAPASSLPPPTPRATAAAAACTALSRTIDVGHRVGRLRRRLRRRR